MNVIDEFTELLGAPPALSQSIRDRAKETLMNELMTLDVAVPEKRTPRRGRRVAAAAVVAIAAAVALIVGIGSPGRTPLAPQTASAAGAIRAAAAVQRALPDTPPNLEGVNPKLVALAPTLADFPTTGTPEEVWAWLDSHCEAATAAAFGVPVGDWTPAQGAEWARYFGERDCGLMSVFGYLSIASSAQRAALLDALATLPKITAVPGCKPTGGAPLHPNSQEFAVSRNGTDTILSITENSQAAGQPIVMLVLTGSIMGRTFDPPCPAAPPERLTKLGGQG